MRLAPLLGLGLLLGLPLLSAAPAYEYAADDCAYAYWLAPTPAASAWRERVPERFDIVGEATGVVVAVVTFVECEFRVNGGAPHRATINDVGVTILPPTGGPGTLDFFHLWQITDSPQLAALNAAWGIPGELAAPRVVTERPFVAPPVTIGYGHVASSLATYGATGFHSPSHEAAPGTAAWWRETDGGLVRVEQAFLAGLAEADGAGEIWTMNDQLRELIPPARLPGIPGAPAATSVSYTDLLGGASLVPE